MSHYQDLYNDSKYIAQIVYEIGKTNKFNNLDFKDVMKLANTIYDDYEYYEHGDVGEYASEKIQEIIELEEMLLWSVLHVKKN